VKAKLVKPRHDGIPSAACEPERGRQPQRDNSRDGIVITNGFDTEMPGSSCYGR
jgi:hypothetical protein